MIESIALKLLEYAVNNFPIAGAVVMLLGILFVIAELFVKATPNKDDDAAWAKWKSGYLGPFITFCMNKVKTLLISKK